MSETTIGIIGLGELSQRMIRSTFNDQLEGADDDGMRLIVPLTKDHFSDEVQAVTDWAIKNELPYEVVTDSSTAKFKIAKEYLDDAEAEVEAKGGVYATIVSLAEEADDGKLFFFWDDGDETYKAFEKADGVGVEAYDLLDGCERMAFGEEGEDDDEPEPTDEPDEGHELDEAAEMGRRTVKDLKAELDELGVKLRREGKGRIAKGPHVAALMGYRETGFKFWLADPEGETAVPDEEAAKAAGEDAEAIAEAEAELEAEDAAEAEEEDVEIPQADDEALDLPKEADTAVAAVDPWPMLTGSCVGCGGPIFALSEASAWPDVQFNHTDGCPIK